MSCPAQPEGAAGGVPVARPADLDDLATLVREATSVFPRGGGTKAGSLGPGPAPAPGPGATEEADGRTGGLPAGAVVVDTTGLEGVVEYEPAEFTVTARAGTRVATIEALLARHGQYLPFDPLLVDAGATLGGTVAAGVSGPCRMRYGGVRDFVLGVTLVDGQGQVIRGGGRVVKNAAGYDLPKFLCGSLGRFGVLAEVTFKVFPRPEAFATACFTFATLEEAAAALAAVYRSPLEPHALELAGPGLPGRLAAAGATGLEGEDDAYVLLVRVGGPSAILAAWVDRVIAVVAGAGGARKAEVLQGEPDERLWRTLRELRWTAGPEGAGPPLQPSGPSLLRLYARPSLLPSLDALLRRHGAVVLHTQAGTAAWALLPGDLTGQERASLLAGLAGQGVPTLCWRGSGWAPHPPPAFAVPPAGTAVARALKEVFDPAGRFPALPWAESPPPGGSGVTGTPGPGP